MLSASPALSTQTVLCRNRPDPSKPLHVLQYLIVVAVCRVWSSIYLESRSSRLENIAMVTLLAWFCPAHPENHSRTPIFSGCWAASRTGSMRLAHPVACLVVVTMKEILVDHPEWMNFKFGPAHLSCLRLDSKMSMHLECFEQKHDVSS